MRISPAPVGTGPSRRSALLFASLGALCLAALFDMGAQYEHFKIPQYGVDAVDTRELAFYLWYGVWGSAAVAAFAIAVVRAGLAQRVASLVERALHSPGRLVAVAAIAVFGCAFAVRELVLLGEPVTDDESTYLFEAQTLLHGRVINPLPADRELFTNQFIILGSRGWYGKYPIGHPLVLALGEALKVRSLIIPLVGALALWLTFSIGQRLFERKRAALGAALLVVSPQFVFTHATLLSQPTSALCMLVGMWALLQDVRLRWPMLAGAAFGFMLLARPMPGALCAFAALAYELVPGSGPEPARALPTRVRRVLAMAPGLALGVLVIALCNKLQAGDPLTSGYKTVHHEYGLLGDPWGEIPSSLAGALVRQNFWLFGWTASLLFVPFARPRRGAVLFWGMIAADYAYRVLVPKVMVSTTGPIYVFECVPLLALATADGATRIEPLLRRLASAPARAWVAALGLCSIVVALVVFVPIELRAAHRSSELRARVYRLLAQRRAKRALVFADLLVNPSRAETWAYYPPCPSPTLDDDILFVRQPSPAAGPRAAWDIWHARFADRRAFAYADAGEHPFFFELSATPPPPDPPPPQRKRRHSPM